MARPPDGPTSRESTISIRVAESDRKEIQANRFASGDRSNSNYIRRLVREDTKRRLEETKSA